MGDLGWWLAPLALIAVWWLAGHPGWPRRRANEQDSTTSLSQLQPPSALSDEEREADIDTLGGLVMSLTDRVPLRGELVTHPSGITFEVLDADPRRIKRLRVRNVPDPAKKPEPATKD